MRTWRWIAVLAVLAVVLAACGTQTGASPSADDEESEAPAETGEASAAPSEGGDGEPVAGGTLVFAGARLASSLDPVQTSDGESFRILQQIYEPLVDLAPGTTSELVGILAESWEGGPEDTTYVFHLREGVTFHDGTPFNAEAVKINFDRWQNFVDEFQANAYYYGATMNGFGEGNLIESVEATDEFTVTFNLTEPSPTFLFAITLPAFAIVSPAVLEETNASDPSTTFGEDVTQAGTGPFMLESYTPEEEATLVRNEDYWGEPALLDRVIIRPIADPAARLQALQGGSVQGYDLVNPADYETIEGEEGLVLVERLSFNSLYLGLNPTAAETAGNPLAEQAVREAVEYAIDKEALIEPFYGGRGSVADIFLPPSSGWHDAVLAGVEPRGFDPDRARELLAEAGFDESNPAEVGFWYPTEVTRPYMPDPAGLHQAITQMLEDVGFVVVPNSDIWDSPGYLFDAQNGLYDLHFLGWTGDYDDPSNWYGVHFGYDAEGAAALQFGCDVEGLNDAIVAAEAELEEGARGAAWAEVARIIHENVCFITLVHGDTALAFTEEVQGYTANPTGSETFSTVWLTNGGE